MRYLLVCAFLCTPALAARYRYGMETAATISTDTGPVPVNVNVDFFLERPRENAGAVFGDLRIDISSLDGTSIGLLKTPQGPHPKGQGWTTKFWDNVTVPTDYGPVDFKIIARLGWKGSSNEFPDTGSIILWHLGSRDERNISFENTSVYPVAQLVPDGDFNGDGSTASLTFWLCHTTMKAQGPILMVT